MPTRAIRIIGALITCAACAACAYLQPKPVRTVLFDEAHNERFLPTGKGELDLSRLAGLFRDEGFRIATSQVELSDEVLSQVDAVIVSGPFTPLSGPESDSVLRFLQRGGRACFLLHIGPPIAPFLTRLGVFVSNGVIRERENVIGADPLNFRITRFGEHPLTKGLTEFGTYGAWAVMSEAGKGRVVAETSPAAWVDLNGNRELDAGDAVQSLGIIVTGEYGRGRFAVFGDDAIFQNRFLTNGNITLGRNLARWLAAS